MRNVIALIIVSALVLAACAQTGPAGDQPIKIGAVQILSGELVDLGHGSVNGVRMAVDDFEAETGRQVMLIEEDDKSCSDKTSGASKLVNLDGVRAIVGVSCSSMTLAIAPITESQKVLLVSGISTAEAVSDAGEYIFRTIPSDGEKSVKTAEEILDKGYQSIAYIYVNDNDASTGAIEGVKDALGDEVPVVLDETISGNTHDFRTILVKMQNADPDVLVMVLYSKQFGEIMKQMDELGITHPAIYTPIETLENPIVIEVGGESVDGIFFPAFAPASGSAADDFRQRYEARFGEQVPPYAAEAYDGTIITLNALAASSTPEEARAKMYEIGTDYPGASGPITFDENGDVHKPLLMKTIRDGEFVVVG